MTAVVISGCSGAGKSTLLAELAARGHRVFEEPGRRVVKDEMAKGGGALPWADVERFVHRCIALALADLDAARAISSSTFFDRSLIDAVSALEHLNLAPPRDALAALEARPYHRRMFMAPPWPRIYAADAERRHSFADAEAEYERLMRAYPRYGIEVVLLPKVAPADRADFVLRALTA